jgi:hypothetical protein
MKKHPLLLLLLSYLQLLRRGRRTAELLEAWQRLNGLDLGLGHLFVGVEVWWWRYLDREGEKRRKKGEVSKAVCPFVFRRDRLLDAPFRESLFVAAS